MTKVDQNSNINNASGVTTVAVSTTVNVNAGELVAVIVFHEGAPQTISVSDGTSSLTPGTKVNHSNGDLSGQWFYILSSVATGAVTYTATFGAAVNFPEIMMYRASYTGTASFDAQIGQETNPSNTATTSGNLTATGTDNITFCGVANYSGNTLSSPLVNGVAATGSFLDGFDSMAFYRTTTSGFTGACTATWTPASIDVNVAISFKATAGGGPTEGEHTFVNTRLWLGSLKGLVIGQRFDSPVSDRAVASINRSWNYTQQFGNSYLQINARDRFDFPVSERAIASVNRSWNYSVIYKTSPAISEHEPVKDQAVAQVNAHWSFTSWFNKLFGSPLTHNVVVVIVDGTPTLGVNRILPGTYAGYLVQQPVSSGDSDLPISADSAAQVTGHWPFGQQFKQFVGKSEETPVFATTASSLIYSWFVPRWVNRLFNTSKPADPVVVIVTDGTVSGVNRSWGYGRQLNQQMGQPESNPVQEPSPVASVNRSWVYTQQFSRIARSYMQSVMDGIPPIVKKISSYIPTFRPRRR